MYHRIRQYRVGIITGFIFGLIIALGLPALADYIPYPLPVSKGGTGAAPGADDQVLVANSTSSATWRTLTTCAGADKAVNYDTATNTFSCNTFSGSGLSYANAAAAVMAGF